MEDFEQWARNNGADDNFLDKLKVHGFSSRLSLSFLDVESPEGQHVFASFNFGQRCLLQGLVQLAKVPSTPNDLDQPYFFQGRGGNVALLMHIKYTHTVGNLIVMG